MKECCPAFQKKEIHLWIRYRIWPSLNSTERFLRMLSCAKREIHLWISLWICWLHLNIKHLKVASCMARCLLLPPIGNEPCMTDQQNNEFFYWIIDFEETCLSMLYSKIMLVLSHALHVHASTSLQLLPSKSWMWP